jgi:hypothetical protein
MRSLVLVSLLLLIPTMSDGQTEALPITPDAAAKKLDQKCTVEMLVRSTGKGNGVFFLNSQEDYKNKENFTVFINKDGAESLKKAKIDAPLTYFKGKTVHVTGTVVLYNKKPEIILDKAEQIKIVDKAALAVTLHDLLEPVTLPAGYSFAGQELKVKDKVVGYQVLINKDGQYSKVIVRIEFSNRSEAAARSGAAKAYVNGFADAMADAGYKIESKKLPDIAKESFEKPIAVDLTLVNGEGKKLYSHQEIFFTDKGFVTQVLADDPTALASLTTWAKTVKARQVQKGN